jgi:hypothetical protein
LRGVGPTILVFAAVEVDNLDLLATRELHVMMYAGTVVFVHCLSLALIDPGAAGL